MHMPRIFTTPVMSGYAYSGLSSTEYKNSLCRAITSGLMAYDEFLKVLREFMLELRSTLNELQDVDGVFASNAGGIEVIESCITDAESAEPTARKSVLFRLIHHLYDVLQGCAAAPCNKEVSRFMDASFIRRGAHLQIAKACGVLVNSIVIVNCCARTIAEASDSAIGEADEHSAFHANMALSAYVNAKFSALSRCLNSSPGAEETKRRKAILRVVRHNIELCNKVAELLDPEMPSCFRDRTGDCLDSLLAAVRSSSAECKEMVRNNESAQRRLDTARRARSSFVYHLRIYSRCYNPRWIRLGEYTRALVYVIGSLFSIYRGYASTGNADHVVAGKFEHCLRILLVMHSITGGITMYKVRKIYLDMLCVYAEINEHIRPDLLLNPQAEIRWRDAALQYCTELMDIRKALHGRHLDVFEQPEGSPSQPSTSGLGSTSAGVRGPQASSVPLRVLERIPIPYDAPWDKPSTSGMGGTGSRVRGPQASSVPLRVLERIPIPYGAPWDQPSTSGMGGTAGTGSQQASHIPPHDPGMMPYSYAQPSTSGLGGTGSRVRGPQASSVPLRVLERIPIPYGAPWDQPSTSGLGSASAGVGRAHAPYMPPQDQGTVPYLWDKPSTSYAHPSTLWDQPSTSGLGCASSTLEEAQVSSHRSRTPSDDDSEPPSKQARRA
ncbi:hypothetical protein O997_02265 [Anaplasma phagocytophilum str. MRK]|uniref:HGE-14 family type IV secretion system effector n=1 Tax=Anaplasma phagocytophilum TaxID=948 RepID=UPI000533A6C6|nr:hypothetical protein [Anaplasma phagocytophilum]KDB56199.1 hypothetical protein O997_02265 [Anaplasma phagocytophilum str. MRK]